MDVVVSARFWSGNTAAIGCGSVSRRRMCRTRKSACWIRSCRFIVNVWSGRCSERAVQHAIYYI